MPESRASETGGQWALFFARSNLIKQLHFVALLALMSICLQGCAKTNDPNSASTSDRRVIVDDSGRSVSLPVNVLRVVSLAPNLTEIVFAVGAGDRLVGRTSYCDFPPEAKTIAEVGDTMHPSLERIIALKPQVVLVSTASQLEAFTRQLQEHDIAVFVTDPHDLNGVFHSIEQIGEIVGAGAKARQTTDALKLRVMTVASKLHLAPPVRVFYQLSAEPLYTAGKDAFVNDLIQFAGGISVTADVPGAWPKFSAEAALATKPDAIILPTGGSMGDNNTAVVDALKRSPAVLHGRVYKINDDHLVRPGPRAVDGLEELAKALHPEAFKQ